MFFLLLDLTNKDRLDFIEPDPGGTNGVKQ